MKNRRLLAALLLLCTLISSCASTGESVMNSVAKTDEMTQKSNKKLYKLSVKEHSFCDDNVLIEVVPAGDRMYLSFTNNSKDRILLHIESARVSIMGSDDTSQIITFEQSRQNTNHFTVPAIVVNPFTTFTEKYVALDSMSFDAFKSQRFIITEWATDEDFQLLVSYGLITHKGEIVKNIIIN